MKKLILLMAVLLTTALSVQAQRTVSGQVIDDVKEPVIQATVALLKTDSTLVGNTVTDAMGQFSVTAPKDGKYLLRITYVGYKSLFRSITMAGKPIDMGTLQIQVDAIMLKGTEIVKNMARVYSKEDTIIYNAGAYKTPEGSVLEELVKRLPGAELSDDGKITINGKEVKKIKVDGKEFMTGDTQTAMKNLPTSIVERVKAYDEKSDQTRITGVDDGNEEMVLDFGLKRGMNRGTFANADFGIGTKERYTGRLMGMTFKDDFRIMGFTNANNVGDRGFGGGGPGGRFGGGGQGLQAPKMFAVNMNYEKKNLLKLDGGVRWNHNDGDTWSRTATENFVSKTGAFSNSVNQGYSRSNSWSGNFRVEWTPDTMTNIHFRPSFSISRNDGLSQSFSAAFAQDPYNYVNYALDSRAQLLNAINYLQTNYSADELLVNSRDNASLSYSNSMRFGGELQMTRKLNSLGRNISLRLTGNYSDGDSKSLSLQEVDLYKTTMDLYGGSYSEYYRNRYNVTPTKNYDYSARLTYNEPVADRIYLQLSYNFQYRYTKSDRSTYDFSEWPTLANAAGQPFSLDDFNFQYRQWDHNLGQLLESGKTMDDYLSNDLSRFSEYKNFIHTGEVMLRMIRKDYNFNVGVQLIPQTSKFSYRYLGVDYGTTTRTVVNWSPTANFRWKISDQGQMRFRYRGSTSQPSMTDLLEIRDDSDPLNVTVGNAGLKPSFTQNFSWRFNNYYQKHQRFVFANLNFSTTSNSVTSKVYYNPETGGRTSTRDNINGNWNARGEFMFNTALDTLGRFNMNTRTTAGYTHSVSYLDVNQDGNIQKNAVNQTSLGQRLGFSYRNDWFEFEPNGSINYTFGRNKLQEQGNQDTWNFSYGFNTTAQLPWGMQLTTNLNMSSRRGYSDASMNTNELIWNAQISQSFLKGNPLSVRLEFYDILGQQSSFSRTLNAMMRSDTETNAINSYVMLRVNYRLNLFGTKEARQSMRNAGGPNGSGGEGRRGNRGGFGGGSGRPGGGFGGPRMF
ncbi:MAG: outer membrane beta-barrel protein [Prevotella sp.]|nr:outer membrane beta-barrel protein [Prevotella sp.]